MSPKFVIKTPAGYVTGEDDNGEPYYIAVYYAGYKR